MSSRNVADWAGLTPPYRTIVADPPWSYRKSKPKGDEQHTRNHVDDVYPSMTMEEIAALPVADLAADDACLFLWTTNPRINGDRNVKGGATPFDIMDAWGFSYRTMITWIKPMGLGSYFRVATEHVLFGVRGKFSIPPSSRVRNHLTTGRPGRHSTKPDEFFDIVEKVTAGPRLELFARRERLGWDVWGNEIGEVA